MSPDSRLPNPRRLLAVPIAILCGCALVAIVLILSGDGIDETSARALFTAVALAIASLMASAGAAIRRLCGAGDRRRARVAAARQRAAGRGRCCAARSRRRAGSDGGARGPALRRNPQPGDAEAPVAPRPVPAAPAGVPPAAQLDAAIAGLCGQGFEIVVAPGPTRGAHGPALGASLRDPDGRLLELIAY